MATSCKIVRNPVDPSIIDFVEAPNEARSILFDDLKQRMQDTLPPGVQSDNMALEAWLTTKTKKFKQEVSNPKINPHRIKLVSRVADIQPSVGSVTIGGQEITVDNMEFTDFQADPNNQSPGARSTRVLRAYGFPKGGGKGVQVGRIRYKVKGNTIEIDSSTLNNVGAEATTESGIKQNIRKALEGYTEPPAAPQLKKDEYGRIDPESTVHLYHSTMSVSDAMGFEGINIEKGTSVDGVFFSKLGSPYRERTPYVVIEVKAGDLNWGDRFEGQEVAIGRDIPHKVIYRSKLSPQEQRSAKSALERLDTWSLSDIREALPKAFRGSGIEEEIENVLNPKSGITGKGIGRSMYAELFKRALKQGVKVVSSTNLSPSSRGMWQSLVRQGIAKQEGEAFALNMYPDGYDQNGEPGMATVLDYIDREGVGPNITVEEQIEIMDTMVGLPVEDSSSLYEGLRRAFMPDGHFKPTRTSLMNSGLYTSENITEIMTNGELQEQIRNFIYKLENLNTVIYNDMYTDEMYNVIEDGSKTPIGTYKLRNPFIVEQEVIETLGGYQNRAQFEEALFTNDVQEIVGGAYEAFKNSATDLFYTMKKYKTADQVLLGEDGLAPRKTGAFEEMYETLGMPQTPKLAQQADLLQSLDDIMWIENPKMADDLLTSIQSELQSIGMDIENLPQMAKINGIEATKEFLVAVRDYVAFDNRDALNNLVETYQELYDIPENFMQTKVPVAQTVPSGNIFQADTAMTGTEAFVKADLIPVGPNSYKRIQRVPVDQMLEAMYDFRLKSNGYEGILPDRALYPAAYDSDGTINMAKVQDPNNREAILKSMKAWAESEAGKLYTEGVKTDMETLQTYVLMFHYYNRSGDYNKFDTIPTMAEEYQTLVNSREIDYEYLTGDFVEQFNLRRLSEKRQNSDMYKNFYSNFKITANGIELVSNDPITRRKIAPFLEENKDLVNYFRIHKTKPELVMDAAPESHIIDDLFRRNYYSNYPTALKPFTGEYTTIKGNTIAASTKQPFLRLPDGAYELVMGVGKFGIFQKLTTVKGEIKRYDPEMRPPALDAMPQHFLNMDATVDSTVQIKNLYDDREKGNIDDKYDNCR